ncbi:MAG: HNH endonuclease signature motif containing protein [Mycobacterium sp.]
MFDDLADAGVLDVMASASRDESAACARRLAAIGELYARRAPDDDVERTNWAIDGHTSLVAEIAAELNISRGRAAGQLDFAIPLRERLPKVAAVFGSGAIDYRMMAALVKRSDIVDDEDALARLDAAFAKWAPAWMRMSGPKLTERIDMWVEKFDPAGVREPRFPREDRCVEFGPVNRAGLAGIWGSLPVTDAVVVDDRLDAVAATVCRNDSRTVRQRRADALVAMAAGQDRLECGCGDPQCPAAGIAAKPWGEVVIHLLAEQAAVDGHSENPGYLSGFGPVPAPLLRELAATAKLKPLPLPPPVAEPSYRPSTALAEFVRCRDLTCRFPGCTAPAEVCDIDHTIAYPVGSTHPSNLKLLCRFHHLLKTFWTGVGGWADRQLPDGTVIWTSPSGRIYTTKPGGSLFFPALATPTGQIVVAESAGESSVHRGLMMPTRRRTRAQDRAYRIARERAPNEVRVFLERKQEFRAWLHTKHEPPPF